MCRDAAATLIASVVTLVVACAFVGLFLLFQYAGFAPLVNVIINLAGASGSGVKIWQVTRKWFAEKLSARFYMGRLKEAGLEQLEAEETAPPGKLGEGSGPNRQLPL